MSYSPYLVYNGNVIDAGAFILTPANRAFRYGDGVFESIRVINGSPNFVEHHWKRAREGMRKLEIENNLELNPGEIKNQISELLQRNNIKEGGRIRMTIWRESDGFYLPGDNKMAYLIEAYPIPHNEYTLNREGLFVDVYNEMKKQTSPLSAFKLISANLYIMASLYARKQNLGDALLVNDRQNIIESSRSNLFIVSNGVLYTPAISEGCLGGVMRMQVINVALERGIKVYECALTPQHLLAADEMFLTNAIQGPQWVASYRMKRYFHRMSDQLVEYLNEKVQVS